MSYGYRIRQQRGPLYIAHLERRIKELEREVNGGTFQSSEKQSNEYDTLLWQSKNTDTQIPITTEDPQDGSLASDTSLDGELETPSPTDWLIVERECGSTEQLLRQMSFQSLTNLRDVPPAVAQSVAKCVVNDLASTRRVAKRDSSMVNSVIAPRIK